MSRWRPLRVLRRLDAGRSLIGPDTLTLDGRSPVRRISCPGCGTSYQSVTSFVLLGGDAHAIARTALHDHDGREAWINAIFGSFSDDPTADDRVTFGCRIGAIDGYPEPAASAIDAAQPYEDSATWGHKLTREEALGHPRLSEFWNVVDFLLEHERSIRRHMQCA